MEERKIFSEKSKLDDSSFEVTSEKEDVYTLSIDGNNDYDGEPCHVNVDFNRDQLRALYKALMHEFFIKENNLMLPSNDVANLPVGIFPTTEAKIEYLNATMRITDDEQEAINRILKKQKEDERKKDSQS